MKPNSLDTIEKNVKFKKKYFPKQLWIKTPSLYLPVFFLFLALAGLVYLLNFDVLFTFRAIPFIILFFIATLWFKSLKKHIQNKYFNNPESFTVCTATILDEDNDYVYLVFTNQEKRHNKYFIEAEAKNLEQEGLLTSDPYKIMKGASKSKTQNLNELIKSQDTFYLKAFKRIPFFSDSAFLTPDKTILVLYINDGNTLLIKQKDINL